MRSTDREAFLALIMSRAEAAREATRQDAHIGRFVDDALPIPRPHLGTGDIRLILIGQDPTVQRAESRSHINTMLNLDQPQGVLYRYLRDTLCAPLGLSIEQPVYATNACKCFWTMPPTAILNAGGINVLEQCAPYWLPLLRDELVAFPAATVVSLGEPVLAMLAQPGGPRKMINFWGYHVRWRSGLRVPMRALSADASTVGRAIHPFIHQPTLHSRRAEFYRKRMGDYIKFVQKSLRDSSMKARP